MNSAIMKNLYVVSTLVNTTEKSIVSGNFNFFIALENFKSLDFYRYKFFGHSSESLKIFDWLIQYQACKTFFAEIPELKNMPFPKAVWAELEKKATTIDVGIENDYILDRIDTWILESYSLKGLCEVMPGDIVFDCGAYTGNTSLYFSQKTGAEGCVYSFEPTHCLFKDLRKNLKDVKNVVPIKLAVSKKKETVYFAGENSGGRIDAAGTIAIAATSIDEFCLEQNIKHIDFIKMDIEGAEADALAGAKNMIKQCRPKMALSAYHKAYDTVVLPQQILQICPDYTFYLGHFAHNDYETVLYCVPSEDKPSPIADCDNTLLHENQLVDFIAFMNNVHLNFSNILLGNLEERGADNEALTTINVKLMQENAKLKELLEKVSKSK